MHTYIFACFTCAAFDKGWKRQRLSGETAHKDDEVDFLIDFMLRELFCVNKDPVISPVPDKVYAEALQTFLSCHPGARHFFLTFSFFICEEYDVPFTVRVQNHTCE